MLGEDVVLIPAADVRMARRQTALFQGDLGSQLCAGVRSPNQGMWAKLARCSSIAQSLKAVDDQAGEARIMKLGRAIRSQGIARAVDSRAPTVSNTPMQ